MKRFYSIVACFIVFTLIFQMFPSRSFAAAQTERVLEFIDLKHHWAKSEITRLVESGIVSGYPDNTFKPDAYITREEFLKILIESLKYEPIRNIKLPFTDVTSTRWSAPYIQTALDNDIIIAADYGNFFQPAKYITRLEMAAMISRALFLEEDLSMLNFKDNDSIGRDKGLVGAAITAELITGFPDNTFRPDDSTTRAQSAAVIIRTLDYERHNSDEYIYKPGVIVLDEENYIITGDTLSLPLTAETRALTNGDIVVLPPSNEYPYGVAQRVVSNMNGNHELVLRTTEPAVEEVIEDFQFYDKVPVKAEYFQAATPYTDNITAQSLKKETFSMIAALNDPAEINVKPSAEGILIGLKNLKVPVGDKEILLAGEINLEQPEVVVDADVGFIRGIERLKYEFISDSSIELEAVFTEDRIKTEKIIPLGKMFVPVYGPFGVTVELNLLIKADLTAGVVFTLENENHIDLGVQYTNKKTQWINNTYSNANVTLSAETSIKAEAGPKLGVYLAMLQYNLAGLEAEAGIQADVATKLLSASTGGDLESLCYVLDLEAFARGKATLFVPRPFKQDLEISYVLAEIEKTLIQKDTCQKPLTMDEAQKVVFEGIKAVSDFGLNDIRADDSLFVGQVEESVVRDKYNAYRDELREYFSEEIIDEMFGLYYQYFLYYDCHTNESDYEYAFQFHPVLKKIEDTHYRLTLSHPERAGYICDSMAMVSDFDLEYQMDNWVITKWGGNSSYAGNTLDSNFTINLSTDEARIILENSIYFDGVDLKSVTYVETLKPRSTWAAYAPKWGSYYKFEVVSDNGTSYFLVFKETGKILTEDEIKD